MTLPGKRRFHELDSLRGLAALTVVIYHFRNMWLKPDALFHMKRWQKLIAMMFDPLVAGPEAVMLFFILSGFVLSLPFHAQRNQTYGIFAVRRILRIYGPYLVALVLTVGCAALWHQDLHRGLPGWANPPQAVSIVQHVLFLGLYDWHAYNGVIWSLIYEMRISLIFPLLMLLVGFLSDTVALALVMVCTIVPVLIVGEVSQITWRYSVTMTVYYIAFFIVGILLARKLGVIGEAYRSLSRNVRIGLLVVSFLLYTESGRVAWWVFKGHLNPTSIQMVSDWFLAFGACGYIVAALHSYTLQRCLTSPAPLFLGKISYSLYLVHMPLLFVMTLFLGDRISPWLQLPIFVAGSLALGYAFYKFVELPFTNLSQSYGRRKAMPLVANEQTLGSR